MKKEKNQQAKKKTTKNTGSDRRKIFGVLLAVFVVTIIAYAPILKNGFVWDDDNYIQNNLLIRSLDLKEIFSQFVYGNYHPITILFHSIEFQFFGLKPMGYHLVNLLIHLLNTVLVYKVIKSLSKNSNVALISCLLFGVHPMHVESVAWAAELKDLLYTFFFLTSYLFYLRYLDAKDKKSYYISLLLFFFSLMSKAMAASLPVLLLVTDYFHGASKEIAQRRNGATKINFINKIPYFILSVVFGIIAIRAQESLGATDIVAFDLPQRIVFACYGFVMYIVKMISPIELCAFYPYPVKAGADIPTIYYGYAFLFLLIAGLTFYSLKSTKKVFMGISFFAITVFLVLQLLPVGGVIMADRYAYVPSIGIFYILAEGIIFLLNRNRSEAMKYSLIGLIVLLAGLYAMKTNQQCKVWKNGLTLWNDVIRQYQVIPMAYNNRGAQLARENDVSGALNDYNRAIELEPGFSKAYSNRGILFAGQNNNDDALRDFNKAIELEPDYAGSYNNRGGLYIYMNRYDEALVDFNKAIKLDPSLARAYFNRGMIEFNYGRKDSACADLLLSSKLGFKDADEKYNELCK